MKNIINNSNIKIVEVNKQQNKKCLIYGFLIIDNYRYDGKITF